MNEESPADREIFQQAADEIGYKGSVGMPIGLVKRCSIEIYTREAAKRNLRWQDIWKSPEVEAIRKREPNNREIQIAYIELTRQNRTILTGNKVLNGVRVLRRYLEKIEDKVLDGPDVDRNLSEREYELTA